MKEGPKEFANAAMDAASWNCGLGAWYCASGLEESVRYSKREVPVRQSISNFQAIQWMIADMGTAIEVSRT